MSTAVCGPWKHCVPVDSHSPSLVQRYTRHRDMHSGMNSTPVDRDTAWRRTCVWKGGGGRDSGGAHEHALALSRSHTQTHTARAHTHTARAHTQRAHTVQRGGPRMCQCAGNKHATTARVSLPTPATHLDYQRPCVSLAVVRVRHQRRKGKQPKHPCCRHAKRQQVRHGVRAGKEAQWAREREQPRLPGPWQSIRGG
jgi:hypothetical protein